MKKSLLALLSFLLAIALAFAGDELPMFDKVRYGRLPNGLSYYLMFSPRPAYKTNFYLVCNVGSTVETPDQAGFAHFVEHMAFNGSKGFPGKSMQTKLEEYGLRYGYDLNASTGFDVTTYYISGVEYTGQKRDETCLKMLHEISCNLTLDDEAIESERRVIIEEWRQGESATRRMQHRMTPVLFGEDNRYASRFPIGTVEVLESFAPDSLRAFYEKWYQPQHQAIFVIGYIDPVQMEKKIKRLWSDVKVPANPSVRRWEQVPDHEGIRTAYAADREYPGNQMDFWWKVSIPERGCRNTKAYVVRCMLFSLLQDMMKTRLSDVILSPDSPWTGAGADYDTYYSADAKDAFRLYAIYDRNRRDDALRRLISEIKRAASFGVTPSEMTALTASLRLTGEQYPLRISDANSYKLFDICSEHFTKTNPILNPETEGRIIKQFADTLSIETVNATLASLLRPDNLVVMLSEKAVGDSDSLDFDLHDRVLRLWDEVEVEPFPDDDAYTRPILPVLPEPGKVFSKRTDSPIPARIFTFDNGARAIVCRSVNKSEQITVTAVRRGGYSDYIASDFAIAKNVAAIGELGGYGDFSSSDLRKRLSHTNVHKIGTTVSPYATMLMGASTLDELETLLQLFHLRLTTNRTDTTAFRNWQTTAIGMLNDRHNNIDAMFADSVNLVIYGPNHPSMRDITVEDIRSIDYDRAVKIHQELLSDPASFTFIINGDLDQDAILPLLERYIGSLPKAEGRKSDVTVLDRAGRRGCRTRKFTAPMVVPMSKVMIDYEYKDYYDITYHLGMEVLRAILETELIRALREDAGGTYSPEVSVSSNEIDGLNVLSISFDTNPEVVDSMVCIAGDCLTKIANEGPDPELFKSTLEYIQNYEYIYTLQQSYPVVYYTHFAIYGNKRQGDRVAAAAHVHPGTVQSLAGAFLSAPVRATIILNPEEKAED